jgi:DNA-damage-inducible protein J
MTTISVRIDEKVKNAASKELIALGLDLSSGVNMFLRQVIKERGLPFQPTSNPVLLKRKWDREVKEARKRKSYSSAKEMFADLL